MKLNKIMDINAKNSLVLFKDFLKKWEKEYGHAYNYSDLFDFFFPVKEYSFKLIQFIWQQFIKSKNKSDKIDLYINIPFCLQKCDYCITGSHKLKNSNELKKYVDYLIRNFYSFKKTFFDTKFTNLYIGGGTPSILNEKLLNKLLSKLFSCFNFEKKGQRTCELNPINSSFNKLCLLKKNGFNRVSFGVQSFNQGVLNLNNRGYQTNQLVKKSIADANKAGFKNINIDLIAGLYGDSKKFLLNSFNMAVNLNITSISLYPLQPKTSYLNQYFNSNKEEFINFLKSLINSSKKEIIQIIQKNKWRFKGESIIADESFIKNGCWQFIKENFKEPTDYYGLDGNNSIFGVGYYSISSIKDTMRYNINLEQNNKGVFRVIYQGIPQTQISKMLYYISRNLFIQKYISKRDFKSTFSLSFLRKFEKSVNQLKKFNIIKSISGDKIYFKSAKLNEIFLYLLFFLEKENNKLISYKKTMKKINKEKTNKKEQKDIISENVLDGNIIEKKKTFININLKKTNKKIKVLITPKTIYNKLEMSLPSKSISQTKIKWSDINIDDEVSLIMDEDKKKYIEEVRKIIIVSREDE